MAPDDAPPAPGEQTSRATDPPTRRRHSVPVLVGLVFAALAFVWLAQAFVAFRTTEIGDGETAYASDASYGAWGYDFEAYVNAAVRLGHTGTLYQIETLSGPFRPGPYGLYLYSPPLGVALLPVLDMAVADSSVLWYGAHVLALLAAMALMPVRPSVRVWTFVVAAFSFAVIRDMALGNVSAMLLLPLVAAWRWLDRPAGSIGQAVAISIRPTLGIVLIWQLLRRQWQPVAWTLAAGVGLILLTLPFVGVEGYLDYLTVLRNITAVTGVEHNLDLGSTALSMGADEATAGLVLLGGYGLAIAGVLLSLRRDREVGFMVAIGASLLLSPLLWDHYLAALVLPAAFLAERGRPWALALPLLTWLPPEVFPFLAIAATFAPFLARAASPRTSTRRRAIDKAAHPVVP